MSFLHLVLEIQFLQPFHHRYFMGGETENPDVLSNITKVNLSPPVTDLQGLHFYLILGIHHTQTFLFS